MEPRRQLLLTDGELAVFSAIDDLIGELGYAPTYRQILERLGWSSRGSLHDYLTRLRRLGLVEGSGRALRLRPATVYGRSSDQLRRQPDVEPGHPSVGAFVADADSRFAELGRDAELAAAHYRELVPDDVIVTALVRGALDAAVWSGIALGLEQARRALRDAHREHPPES